MTGKRCNATLLGVLVLLLGGPTAGAPRIQTADPAAIRADSLERGVLGHDAAARALLAADAPGAPLAAARVAPLLPAARMAAAGAHWQAGDLRGALGETAAALAALPRHLEACLWIQANATAALALALIAGSALHIALFAAPALRRAGHDLADSRLLGAPGYARAALLGGLILLPAALGQGLYGVLLVLLALASIHATRRSRWVLAVAAALLWLGLYPGLRVAGRALVAPAADPIARAALVSKRAFLLPAEREQLAREAIDRPVALHALALQARRSGDLRSADAHYRELLAAGEDDPSVANGAANVRLGLGDADAAIALYRQAAGRLPSARILFNLSQAYGQSIRLLEQERALVRAQRLDAGLVGELTALDGESPGRLVVDLPIAGATRALARESPSGQAVAAALRSRLAPGALGRSEAAGAAALALLLAGGSAFARRARPSAACRACGARLCPRCDPPPPSQGTCPRCADLPHAPRTLEPRSVRQLRARQRRRARVSRTLSWLVPGAVGVLAERPLSGLALGVIFAAGAASLGVREGLVPDPLAAAGAGRLFFALLAVCFGCAYAFGLALAQHAARGR